MRDSFALNARQLAKQLQFPGPLDMGLDSGVFVQVRSNDESAQFFWDLAPMLETGGVRVVVEDAARLMHGDGLEHLGVLFARSAGESRPICAVDNSTFADCMADLMGRTPYTTALLLGGAQRLQVEPDERILSAIKAARDRVNLEPGMVGRFLIVATWLYPANPSKYVENRRSAFYGATAMTLAYDEHNL
ncbi:hypothetical protein H3H36_02185 [Duganella sp. FT3S]|uniref:Uncharacterized protein n=1 Tax=Rugamonas fusca TaxID=2758568 RepID=A0A7W2EDZ0_9BURK|nr:hypothetical protein [Rugamonas fusca]MBA5604171.1 hypothetical protein [Rugamonas fusca]